MATAITRTDIKPRVSHQKKIANDFQRQKDLMDVYDVWFGDYRDQGEIERFNINYDLFNGRLDMTLYDEDVCLNIESEKINFDFKNITHYPLISQVANAMYGEMISRPFKPLAKDLGSFSQTLRNKKWNDLLRDMINAEIVEPIRQQVTERYMQQNGIQDVFQLTPEEMEQMKADLSRGVSAKTPEEILNFMQNDFQTPTQRQAQQLLDYLVHHQDIKFKQQEGFKHAIVTGREIYYIGDRHGEPIFELVNPKYFTWAGSQNTEWFEDATWAKREQWLTIEDAMQKHAEYFTSKSLKELEGYTEPMGGFRSGIGDPTRDPIQERVMYELSIEDGYLAKKYDHVDYKTKAGQSEIARLYGDVIKKYGANYGYAFGNFGVREAHICWRDKRKMYRIGRIKDGEMKYFWQGEHYEPRPDDVEIREVWVDEIWEGTKLGSTGSNDLYVNIRPIPGQFKSIFNPFGNKLPYVGRNYNTHMNNSKNVSIIDLGKSWQKEFDVTMAQIKHDMATDLGNVFLMSLGWKPEHWKWQDWFDVLRNGKVLMTQLQKHGFGNIDPNLLRSINLSKATDIANKIQLLEYFRSNLIQSMNFNDTRIGAIGQYTTNQNIQQSQVASYNQTEGYFEVHRKIVERALNMFMNRARILYKTNEKRKLILDDVTRTELEMSPDFWYEEWAVEFSTSSEDIRRVEELRAQMMSFVQNGMSFEGILALTLADTPSDIMEIMKKENKRIEEQRQEQLKMQQEQFNAQLQAEAAEKEKDREFKRELQREQLRSQEARTQIDLDKFRIQNDVDRNNIADTIQKAILELAEKRNIEAAKLAVEREKLQEETRLKEMELGLKSAQAEADVEKAKRDADLKLKELQIKEKQANKPTAKK